MDHVHAAEASSWNVHDRARVGPDSRSIRLRESETQDAATARMCRRCNRRMWREAFERRTSLDGPAEKVIRWRCQRGGNSGVEHITCGWFEDEGESEGVLAARLEAMAERAAQRRSSAAGGLATKRRNAERRAARAKAEQPASTDTAEFAALRAEQQAAGSPATPEQNTPVHEAISPAVSPDTIAPKEAPQMPRKLNPAQKHASQPQPTKRSSYTPEQRRRLVELVLDENVGTFEAAKRVEMMPSSVGYYIAQERRRRAAGPAIVAEGAESPAEVASEASDVAEVVEAVAEVACQAPTFRERAQAGEATVQATPEPAELLSPEEHAARVSEEQRRREGGEGMWPRYIGGIDWAQDLSREARLSRLKSDLHFLAVDFEERAQVARDMQSLLERLA